MRPRLPNGRVSAPLRAFRVHYGRVTQEQLALVTTDPEIMHGQAVIRGTRIPVAVILDCLAAGMDEVEVRQQYPTLPDGAVHAALAYGAALAREELVPLEPS
jgi:uncharacterized protein (DUF433 family)